MYQYFFFALSILGVYSIVENLRSMQGFTRLKIHILLILGIATLISTLDFLREIGFDFIILKSIIRVLAMLIFANLFFLIAIHKIPKIVQFLEVFIFIFYTVIILNGFRFIDINGGLFITEVPLVNKIAALPIILFTLSAMSYNLIFIFTNSDIQNRYHLKIRNWVKLLLIIFIPFLLLFISSFFIYFKFNITFSYINTKYAQVLFRFVVIFFVLLRPKFLDEAGYILKFNNILSSTPILSISKFEFLFFGNHYFLSPNASIEDFALKMNHSKSEVNDFIKNHFQVSFNELLNKNRVTYFKELLKSNQQDAFTIEALAEMAGFSNRQAMYVAFKKYENSTPSEFINNL